MMRRSKYNAVKVRLDGYTFDSKAEAARYAELRLLERTGEIGGLEVHPRFTLVDAFTDSEGNQQRAIDYVADFAYWRDGVYIVEDVKGVETPVFKIKKKLFLKRYTDMRFVMTGVRQ